MQAPSVAFAADGAQMEDLRRLGDTPGDRGLPWVEPRGIDAVAFATLAMLIRGQDPSDTTAFRKVFASMFRGLDKHPSIHAVPPEVSKTFAGGGALAFADAWLRTHEPAPLGREPVDRWLREMSLLATRAAAAGAALYIWVD